jgi:hypothetical protein
VSVASSLAAVSIEETLPIVLLSVVGSAVFSGLLLCVRRFDAEKGTDDKGGGGGGSGDRPNSDPPTGSLGIPDPPLGKIRASGPRSATEPDNAKAPLLDDIKARV